MFKRFFVMIMFQIILGQRYTVEHIVININSLNVSNSLVS